MYHQIQNSGSLFCPHSLFVWFVRFSQKHILFPQPNFLFNGYVLCLLWGRNWILKYISGLVLASPRYLCVAQCGTGSSRLRRCCLSLSLHQCSYRLHLSFALVRRRGRLKLGTCKQRSLFSDTGENWT